LRKPTPTSEGASPLNRSNRAPEELPATPAANRLETVRWINPRSVLGLVLVFGAVLAGTVGLQRAQHLVPVYVAARDLPSGVPLSKGDLSLVRVRLPDAELGRYLRAGGSASFAGKMLTLPLRQHMLVPADDLVASREQGDMVELAINLDHGDMLQGLRPGDHVRILGAYSDGLRKGAAQVLVDSAEVVGILEESGGLATGRRERGVQVRLPGERSASVAAAITGGRVFIVKAPPLPSPAAVQGPVPDDRPLADPSGPERPEGFP
jgi:SAF domain